jgi:hypothetical protein
MDRRKATWPYMTVTVRGVPLYFRHKSHPSERARLRIAFTDSQSTARSLAATAIDPGASEIDRSAIDRAVVLQEGAIGWYLMTLWAGPQMPTQAAWLKDDTAKIEDLSFRGPDKKEIAGVAFTHDLCDTYDLTLEDLARCVRILADVKPPGDPEPSAAEVDEIIMSFGVAPEATIS